MKKTITISTLIIACVLMLSGCSSGFPQTFIDKHNEIASLSKDAEQVADLEKTSETDILNKQMDNEDYIDAMKTIETALGKKKDAASKLNSVDSKLTELATLSSSISDAKIKTSAEKFIDISKKENSAKVKYINLQMTMMEKFKTMVAILEKNPKAISAADEKTVNKLGDEIDSINNQINDAEKEMNEVQEQYKVAEKEFFELAGLEKNQ